MDKGKYWLSGFLLLVVLTSSVYFILNDNVRIDIGMTSSTFKVMENGEWVLSGVEYVNLFDGTAKMRASSRSLDTVIGEDNITKVTRIANYKDNISTIEVYTFNPGSSDVTIFPVSHSIQVINGEGKLLQYEVQKLLYNGETENGIPSPQSYGHQMKVEWEYGNYYSRIYKYKDIDEGKLTVKYRINSDDYSKNVRLFDPPISGNDLIIANGENFTLGGHNDTYDTIWVQEGGILYINSTIDYLNLTANNITIDGIIDGTGLITPGGSGGYTTGYGTSNGGAGTGISPGAGGATRRCTDYSRATGGGGAGGAVAGSGSSTSSSYCEVSGVSGGAQVGTTDNNYDKTVWNGSSGGGGSAASGFSSDASGGTGGAGAGWLILKADNVVVSGSLLLNGSNGNGGWQQSSYASGSGGGGGSGGTILIDAINVNISNSTLSVSGGSGGGGTGDQYYTWGGSGGNGAGGRIKIFSSEFDNESATISVGTGSYYQSDVPSSITNLTSYYLNLTTENATGYCNGTVNESRNMTYYWNLYVNDVLNDSGWIGENVSNGENINVINLSEDIFSHNDTLELECIVSDYIYNTTSSSEIKIHQPVYVNINYPEQDEIFGISYINITYGFENYTESPLCWYTNDSGVTNNSITCGDMVIGPYNWLEGENNVTIYSNSSYGYETSSYVYFFTSLNPAEITFDDEVTPLDDSWHSQNYITAACDIYPCPAFKNITYILYGESFDG